MIPKERVLSAIDRKPVDRIPCDLWATPEVIDMLKKRLMVNDEVEIWRKLAIDKIVNLTPPTLGIPVSRYYVGPKLKSNQDIWGVEYVAKEYANGKGKYWEIAFSPLANLDTIEEVGANYVFPSADWFDFSGIVEEFRKYPDYAIECGYASPFFVYNNIRGLEKSLMDLVYNKEYAHYVIGKICDFLYAFHERLFEIGKGYIDIAEVTDDFGMQSGLLISPDAFEDFFTPQHQRLIKLVKSYGIKVFHHDDGAIRPLIPRLIDLGIDILNPIQWKLPGMNPEELKREFGTKICFHGGVDNQETLPFGSEKDIENEVLYLLNTLAADRTGYIIAPCHNIQPITPVENIITMYKAIQHYGRL